MVYYLKRSVTLRYSILFLLSPFIAFGSDGFDPLALQRTLDSLQRKLLIPENTRKLDTINPSALKLLQAEINDIAKGPLAEANGISLAVISATKSDSDINTLIDTARARYAFLKEEYKTLESSIRSQSDLTHSLCPCGNEVSIKCIGADTCRRARSGFG